MTKHRTQVLLEEAQYQALSREAEAAGVSVSDLLRGMVRERYARRKAAGLASIRGIAPGPAGLAEGHDSEMYG